MRALALVASVATSLAWADTGEAEWVDSDRAARIAGYTAYAPRALAKLPERWQRALCAYAAGVNAWREAHGDVVARRFQPLGITPEPWTPADCLLAARGILSLGSPFTAAPFEEYHRMRELVARVGDAAAGHGAGMVIDDAVAIVSEAEMARDEAAYARLKQRPRMPGFDLRSAGSATESRQMSHAWAVSGRRSTTGRPMLESDPQLPLSSPPFFYEFHLAAGKIDARGLGIPGCPGLFIGFNHHLAWGGSALGVDSQVVYLEQLTRDGQGFMFQERPVPFERRLEQIEVKGGPAVIQEVLTNRHGTVFNSLVKSARAGEAYVCYDAQTMDAGTSARMMLEAMESKKIVEDRR